jgi:ferrous iron transport protein B
MSELAMPTARIALVGNPNSGKTALFNALTGSRQKVANYAGVTVERRKVRSRLQAGARCLSLTCPAPIPCAPEALMRWSRVTRCWASLQASSRPTF